MPIFVHGRNTRVLFTNGHTNLAYDLSQFFGDASFTNEVEAAETTTFQTGSAKSFIVGLHSGTYSLSGFYDSTDLTGIDYILSEAVGTAPFQITDPITDHQENTIMVFPHGASTQNERCYMATGINTKYDLKSPVNGVVSCDAEVTANNGIRSGYGGIFPIVGEDTGLVVRHTNTLDGRGPTTKGGMLILGILDLTCTTASFDFQHSVDGTTWVSTGIPALTYGVKTGFNYGVEFTSASFPSTIYRYTRLEWKMSDHLAVGNIYYGFSRF